MKGFEKYLKCKDNVDFCDDKTYLGAVILLAGTLGYVWNTDIQVCMHGLQLLSYLVSWCFEPCQPKMIVDFCDDKMDLDAIMLYCNLLQHWGM